MLVKFTSNTSGEIVMFAEVARRLFDIVGKEGTARGVFTLEQLPAAVEKLSRAVADEKNAGWPADAAQDEDEESGEEKYPPVGLAQRAHPLIELMERTRKNEGFILWEAAQDF